jgi:hypothetical protein
MKGENRSDPYNSQNTADENLDAWNAYSWCDILGYVYG